MAIRPSLLVIADIGGYTRFMTLHRVNLAHAQDVVARLLEAIIDASKPDFRLAKLEGDAALFHATLGEGADDASRLTDQVLRMRRAFTARQRRLEEERVCTCDGCVQAQQLKVKFVAHAGEVAEQKVKRHRELAGVDVILVHRMLKNQVPTKEYVLMTAPVLERAPAAVKERAIAIDEELEGLGTTRLHYVDLARLDLEAAPAPEKANAKWWSLVKLNARSLPFILGFKKSCDGFRNVGGIDPARAD